MKIAVVTNDGTTISAHFGKARYFAVLTIEDGKIVGQELLDRTEPASMVPGDAPDTGSSGGVGQHHSQAIAPIAGCAVVLSGGMGGGMHLALQRARIRPFLTDVADIHEAVMAYIEGRLKNRPDLVH